MTSFALVPLLLCCAVPAWGQDQTDADRRAREYFLKGKKAYQEGLFEEAMKNFKMARSVRPSPILEYNIARCHDKLTQHKEAIEAYKRYLVFSPEAPNRKSVEARIKALEELVRKKPAPVEPVPAAAPETPPATATEEPEEPGAPGAASVKPAVEPTPPTPPAKEPATATSSTSSVSSSEPVHEATLASARGDKKPGAAAVPGGRRSPAPATPDRKGTPVYKKWYFWVAVAGAVVITGFIIAMAVDSDDHVSSSQYPVRSSGVPLITF